MTCLTQASHYPEQKQLYVLPGCLYGKYVKCDAPLFKHYEGSTWHGNDASALKWIFRERLVLIMATGLLSPHLRELYSLSYR